MPGDYQRLLRNPDPLDYFKPGIYDAQGNWLCPIKESQDDKDGKAHREYLHKLSEGRVFIEFAGVTFVWGVFRQSLKPGQMGDMFFDNVPGTGPITSFFTEWDRKTGLPKIDEQESQGYVSLIASMRGRNTARIAGRNHQGRELLAAAGFIISQNVDMPNKR